MLTDHAEDASVAMCENAQALAFKFMFKGIDRNIYKVSVFCGFRLICLNYSTSFCNDDFSS